jgi:hypothetical protein
VLLRGVRTGDDGDVDAAVGLTTVADLGGISSTKLLPTGDGDARETLKRRGFSGTLVTNRNELVKREVSPDVLLAQLVDLLEPTRAGQEGLTLFGRHGEKLQTQARESPVQKERGTVEE